MNYSVVKDALSRCERSERYVKAVSDIATKAGTEVAAGPGATYRILKQLFNLCAYDHPDFEAFFLPPDILRNALDESAKRVRATCDKVLEEAKALVKEGFDVDDIGKKTKKGKTE